MHRLFVAALVTTFVVVLAACSSFSVPVATMDPQVPQGGGPAQPYIGTRVEGTVVQYYVNCRACTVEYSTPNGPVVHDSINGGQEWRVVFDQQYVGSALILNATPPDFGRVTRARITVNGQRIAELEPSASPGAGAPVYLNAVLPAVQARGGGR